MDITTEDRCIFCLNVASSEKEKRLITTHNYQQLDLTNDEYLLAANKNICSACRLSRIIPKYRKKCAILNCNMPRKKFKLRELNLTGKKEHIVREKFQVSKNEKVCQACSFKIKKYIATYFKDDNGTHYIDTYHNRKDFSSSNLHQRDASTPPVNNMETMSSSKDTNTVKHGGRPRKSFSE